MINKINLFITLFSTKKGVKINSYEDNLDNQIIKITFLTDVQIFNFYMHSRKEEEESKNLKINNNLGFHIYFMKNKGKIKYNRGYSIKI